MICYLPSNDQLVIHSRHLKMKKRTYEKEAIFINIFLTFLVRVMCVWTTFWAAAKRTIPGKLEKKIAHLLSKRVVVPLFAAGSLLIVIVVIVIRSNHQKHLMIYFFIYFWMAHIWLGCLFWSLAFIFPAVFDWFGLNFFPPLLTAIFLPFKEMDFFFVGYGGIPSRSF